MSPENKFNSCLKPTYQSRNKLPVFFLGGYTLKVNSVANGFVFKSLREPEEVHIDTLGTIIKEELS